LRLRVGALTMSSTLIDCRGIEKRFDAAGPQVLSSVDLGINKGEFVSIVGPSGCGKTTLLKIIAGIISQSGGTISFDGTDRPMHPADFGMVFQQAALLPWRSVLSNVLLSADIMGLDRAGSGKRARELLRVMQLKDHIAESYPGELSGGMQQRVSIARALLHRPQVLMMDEPFGALDAMTREVLNMHLQDVHLLEGCTVVFVTHSITEAVLLSDKIVVMHAHPGRIAAVLQVDLPRPRTIASTSSAEFRDIEVQVRQILETSTEATH
jgi:NitT/TauT family transport system ATP-binding protein